MFAYRGEAAKREAVRLLFALRQANVGALFPYRDSLKAQLKQADRANARYAVILGDDELAAGVASVRDLATSEQMSVPIQEIVAWLQARVHAAKDNA